MLKIDIHGISEKNKSKFAGVKVQKLKTYIIHVHGNVERKRLMDALILANPVLDCEFITKGNIEDLNQQLLAKYFRGKMLDTKPYVSCAYKHILAMKAVAANGIALILEDDIVLKNDFSVNILRILNEIASRNISNALISIEDSLPKYVPKSQRKAGQFLYQNFEDTRLAGAYLLDMEAAKNLLAIIEEKKSDQTADWFYSQSIKAGIISCYWSHPVLASQKSLDGGLDSLIDNKKSGWFRNWNVWVQKNIKRLKAYFK